MNPVLVSRLYVYRMFLIPRQDPTQMDPLFILRLERKLGHDGQNLSVLEMSYQVFMSLNGQQVR